MRKFLLLAAALMLAALPTVPAAASPVEDAPTTTPIKHVVWMMQDNHSFDNYFGTYPGADGIPSGVCQRLNINRKSTKGCVQPFRIGDTPIEDLSQGPGVQRRQYNNGRMDGFVAAYRRLGLDGTSAMGYYDGSDIPFHWNAADQYVLFDRFFASTKVGSREAYLYWVAGNAPSGQTPLRNSAGYDTLPTIFDKLAERQIPAKFYVENLDKAATRGESSVTRSSQLVKVPLLSMKRFHDGNALAGQVVDLSEYYRDLRNGTLPAVSYIVTTSSSENPPADPSAGSRTLRKVSSELMKSSAWSTSAFMWTYDGWGGWYDHVPPPRVDSRGYGFRVPALLVSPYAKKGVVDHTVLDYTAMLKFIETNWNIEPLSVRDRQSAGLASAFDFTASPRPGALLPWTWPAPQVRAADSPAPVIYAVYGVAAALAIALVGLAVRWRGPITVPGLVRHGTVVLRSGLRSTQGLTRQSLQRFSPARQKLLTVAASWASRARTEEGTDRPARFADDSPAILTVPPTPRPGVVSDAADGWVEWHQAHDHVPASPNGHAPASAALVVIDQKRAEQSTLIPEPKIDDGPISVEQSDTDADAETDAAADTDMQTGATAIADVPAEPSGDSWVEWWYWPKEQIPAESSNGHTPASVALEMQSEATAMAEPESDSWVEWWYWPNKQIPAESHDGHPPDSVVLPAQVGPEPDVGDGRVSVEQSVLDSTMEAAHNVVLRSFAVRSGESYAEIVGADKEQTDPVRGAEPPVGAESATNAEAESPVAAEPATNAEAERATEAEATPELAKAEPATEPRLNHSQRPMLKSDWQPKQSRQPNRQLKAGRKPISKARQQVMVNPPDINAAV